MFSLVYVSSAVVEFSAEELVTLLDQAQAKNASLGITGMLLYKGGNFMQVLEGEEGAVRSLVATIEQDPRHRGLITMLRAVADERDFPEWSMGFRDLRRDDATPPGYSEFLNTPLTEDEFSADPTRCQRLLQGFKQQR